MFGKDVIYDVPNAKFMEQKKVCRSVRSNPPDMNVRDFNVIEDSGLVVADTFVIVHQVRILHGSASKLRPPHASRDR